MTVFCVNSSTTYADITAADAAESGIDYGTPTIFEQSGASTSAVVFSNADYPSSFIYRAASGQETDGTTSTGAQCTGQITSSVVNHEFLNLRTGRITINFSTAGGANLENLVVDGTGGDPILFPTSPTAQTMTNVIVYNCSDAWRATSTNDNVIATNCTAVDCTGFGFLRPRCVDTVALNTGSSAYLQIGGSSSNYWADDGTGSNAITESPATDIFVDYATGDYRILASSSVGAAGAGAFIQTGGPAVAPDDISNTQSVTEPNITQNHVLSVDDMISAQAITEPTLTQSNNLVVDNVNNEHQISEPVLTQGYVLSVDNIVNGQTLSNVTLVVAGGLSVQSLSQLNNITEPVLTQKHNLIVSDISSDQSIENVDLIQNYILSVDDISSLQDLTNIDLVVGNGLIVQSLETGQEITEPNLIQGHVLITNPITQNQFIGNVILNGQEQTIGTVTAAFKESGIDVKYGVAQFTVKFKD